MSLLTPEQVTERRLWRESQGQYYGIDVSKWQKADDGDASTKDDLSWAQMPGFVRFVILKVSQADFRDGLFIDHYDSLTRVRPEVDVGGYHFLDETRSARIQAETYARHVEPRPMTLVPNCDLESVAGADARWTSPKMAGEYALEWMDRVDGLVGARCALYTSARHLEAIWSADKALALELIKRDLWLTTYWDNWPKNSAGPKLPSFFADAKEKGRVVGFQWSSGRLSSSQGGGYSRPVPEIEAWRPNHRLDHNLAIDLDAWRVDGVAAQPSGERWRYTFDRSEDEIWRLNRMHTPDGVEQLHIEATTRTSPWLDASEKLQRYAEWQESHGIKADAVIGPKTRRLMGLK
jgi:GH25 family lysozyme M1 (1,4-beta-N-acetylmuramidase)